jgi:hypothetical protein
MMRLYLDTAPIVYHVERTMPFAGAVDARFTASGLVLVSSELARLECLVSVSSVLRLRLFDRPESAACPTE